MKVITVLLLSISVGFALEVGDQAPDFSLKSVDNEIYTLSHFQGNVIYLYWFGYACPTCLTVAPIAQNIADEFGNHDDFMALGIDHWDGNRSQVVSFKASTGIEFPLLMNGSTVREEYPFDAIDYSIVIDREGVIRYYDSGVEGDTIRTVISQLLSPAVVGGKSGLVNELRISRVYPNPFNPDATIDIRLEKNSDIRLSVYNTNGRLVRVISEQFLRAGSHTFKWNGIDQNGKPAATGMYLIRLQNSTRQETRQAVLLK